MTIADLPASIRPAIIAVVDAIDQNDRVGFLLSEIEFGNSASDALVNLEYKSYSDLSSAILSKLEAFDIRNADGIERILGFYNGVRQFSDVSRVVVHECHSEHSKYAVVLGGPEKRKMELNLVVKLVELPESIRITEIAWS